MWTVEYSLLWVSVFQRLLGKKRNRDIFFFIELSKMLRNIEVSWVSNRKAKRLQIRLWFIWFANNWLNKARCVCAFNYAKMYQNQYSRSYKSTNSKSKIYEVAVQLPIGSCKTRLTIALTYDSNTPIFFLA